MFDLFLDELFEETNEPEVNQTAELQLVEDSQETAFSLCEEVGAL